MLGHDTRYIAERDKEVHNRAKTTCKFAFEYFIHVRFHELFSNTEKYLVKSLWYNYRLFIFRTYPA